MKTYKNPVSERIALSVSTEAWDASRAWGGDTDEEWNDPKRVEKRARISAAAEKAIAWLEENPRATMATIRNLTADERRLVNTRLAADNNRQFDLKHGDR